MSLLGRVATMLDLEGVERCLVGAAALAAHGIGEPTDHVGLLTVDARVLEDDLWEEMLLQGVEVTVRCDDEDDPWLGAVNVTEPPDAPVDIIVGREAWHRQILERAAPVHVGGVTIAVAEAADVVLLEIAAGVPQEMQNVARLLSRPESTDLAARVESRLSVLPEDCRALWSRLRADS